MAYWITDQVDLAFSHRYFIRLTVNGVTDMQRGGVFEAVMQPGGDFLEQWSPGDSEGDSRCRTSRSARWKRFAPTERMSSYGTTSSAASASAFVPVAVTVITS